MATNLHYKSISFGCFFDCCSTFYVGARVFLTDVVCTQLYHTKLEQLLTLTGRLNALSNTLGPEFYSRDIVESSPAIGQNEDDPNSHRDVTPERFSKLEKELVRGKGEVVSMIK